jgi:prolycopene isomerase
MATTHDVVVVGAGLGGLSAATRLAREGADVLLLERHTVPGGYATSFVRGRYEFEVALHELSGIGTPDNRGGLYHYLERIGVAQKVEFLPVGELYRTVLPGLDLVVPVGREAMEETLCEAFPAEAAGIKRFLGRVFTLGEELQQFKDGARAVNPYQARHAIRYLPATWGKVLSRDVGDPVARAAMSQYWGYFGLGPSEVAFLYFASALANYATLGPAYVKGRSQALSNAFVAAFEEAGGTVHFHAEVDRIEVRNGRVRGVRTTDGRTFEAKVVVANADPITACRDLVGPEHVPRRWWRGLRNRTVSASSINVYLGVAAPPEQLGLSCHENFLNEDHDFDRHAKSMGTITDPAMVLATCYNAVDPDISPPGTSSIVLTTLQYGEPWMRLDPATYVETKNRVADAMIRRTEEVAPGLREHTEVVEVATPVTNMRYTRQLTGSIYGFENTPHDHTVLRLSHRGPIPGLWFAGAWTQPGGGFEPCILSGRFAATGILKELGGRHA